MLLILIFFLSLAPLSGLENRIAMGVEDNWSALSAVEGVRFVEGKRGYTDIVLQDGEYEYNVDTDLLLHFNDTSVEGAYVQTRNGPEITEKLSRLGSGSAVFYGHQEGVTFRPEPGAMFSPGTSWGDFTIEFWLYPATLDEGSMIVSWDGSRFSGETIIPQKARCGIVDGVLVWRFENLFVPPDYGESTVELEGRRPLVPEQWEHHLLRYDSTTNMLEYLVNGVPEAITHATSTGGETGIPYIPFTGEDIENVLSVGDAYNGLLDEMRFSRIFVQSPQIETFTQEVGSVVTRVFDLGYSNSHLTRIHVEEQTPGETGIRFFYRLGETIVSVSRIAVDWNLFDPGMRFDAGTRGRYLQLRAELYPDGTGEASPRLSTIDIYYEPDLPPHPPGWIEVTPANKALRVRWQAATDSDVAGYLVYYGDRPGRYFGTGSTTGQSPVDAGNSTEIVLEGLENGRLYYIAVVSYDSSDPPHRSYFSEEAAARPTGMK